MNPNQEKNLMLPNGDTISVRVPSLQQDLRSHVIDSCKFHIPLSKLEAQLKAGKWPNIEIPNQELGTQSEIEEGNLWNGTEEEWKKHLKAKEGHNRKKRLGKLLAIRQVQNALRKITDIEWKSLNTVFSIQRQFGK